ncbi:MAG: AbrB/MazE/SpoVT family DNA-binding domain-containing protein [Desulfurococcales archaeon]|nr:AbrB/MazE/SpoVT family DNA-binding domain-containing protein [Desulfurococcales archaeon]
MVLVLEVTVGRRRTIVIPKRVAEMLGISEGSRLELRVEDGRIVLEPIPDAVELSLHGEKVAMTGLEELEAESIEQQRRYIGDR